MAYDPNPTLEGAEAASKLGVDAYYLYWKNMGYIRFLEVVGLDFHENFKQIAEDVDKENERR